MKQADVLKHIAAGTPLAVIGAVSPKPTNWKGRFTSGHLEKVLEPQTRAVAIAMAPVIVRGWENRDGWAGPREREIVCVTVRLDDGSTGLVAPLSISGTWEEWEAVKADWKARADAKRGAFERQLAAAGVLGGRARDGGVFLSLARAEELAAEIVSDRPKEQR